MSEAIDSVTVTHLTGGVIWANGRKIQRCAICGEKLCDSATVTDYLPSDATEIEFPTWEPDRLVRHTVKGQVCQWEYLGATGDLPDDSCLALVEK